LHNKNVFYFSLCVLQGDIVMQVRIYDSIVEPV